MGLNNFILTCEKDNKELRKDIEYYKNYNKRLKQENKQLKEVIDEVRKYVEKHPCDTWYYTKKKSNKMFDLEIIRRDKELLQILDKVKDMK